MEMKYDLLNPTDNIKEKIFDKIFVAIHNSINNYKKVNLTESFVKKYFNDYFKNIEFDKEFDYYAVTDFLLKNIKDRILPIFVSENRSKELESLYTDAIHRGKGNSKEIKQYCKLVVSFIENLYKNDISQDTSYTISKLINFAKDEIIPEIRNAKELKDTSHKMQVYTANKLYISAFEETLFLHRDKNDSSVNLVNLFVPQKYREFLQRNNHEEKNKFLYNNLLERLTCFVQEDVEQFLFIEGDAGSGKSTLMSWLNYHFEKKDKIGKQIFDNKTLLTIRLRDLDKKIIGISGRLISAILSYMKIDTIDDLEAMFPNAVMILDGFDELCMIENILDYEHFLYDLNRIKLHNFKFIITTRPKYIKISSLDFLKKYIFLEHFDKEQRITWLNNYMDPNLCNQKVDQEIKEYIECIDDSYATGVCDTPMSLYMLVARKISNESLTNNWCLYHQIFFEEINETEYNQMFPDPNRDYAHRIIGYRDIIYRISEEIAYKMYCSGNSKFYLSSDELQTIIEKLANNDDKLHVNEIKALVKRCYALCSYWKVNSDYGVVEFRHNNIRDFFLCEKIYREINTLYQDSHSVLEIKNIVGRFCDLFHYNVLETTVTQFIYLRSIYGMIQQKYEFPAIEYKNRYLPKIYELMLTDGSVFSKTLEKNPIQKIINVLTCVAQVYRYIYEPFLQINEKIIWWNSVQSINENGMLQLVFHSVFCQVPVTINYNKMITLASKSDFSGVNLKSCDLRNIGFQYSELSNVDFSNAILTGCDFSNANLNKTDFSNADLHYTSLIKATLDKCIMTGADLRGANLPNGDCVFDQKVQVENLKLQNIKGLII